MAASAISTRMHGSRSRYPVREPLYAKVRRRLFLLLFGLVLGSLASLAIYSSDVTELIESGVPRSSKSPAPEPPAGPAAKQSPDLVAPQPQTSAAPVPASAKNGVAGSTESPTSVSIGATPVVNKNPAARSGSLIRWDIRGRPVPQNRVEGLVGAVSMQEILKRPIMLNQKYSLASAVAANALVLALQPGDEIGSGEAGPSQTADAQTVSLQPAAAGEYYAGLVENLPESPAFPKIQIGTVKWIGASPNSDWSPQPSNGSAPVAEVTIAVAGLSAELWICCRTAEGTTPSELSLDIRFTSRTPQDQVRDLEGLQMRQTGNVHGDSLVAKVVPQSAGAFRVLLAQTPADFDRNKRLLLGRPWIDIPLNFASGRKAVLTFTAGKVGADIIDQALRPWH